MEGMAFVQLSLPDVAREVIGASAILGLVSVAVCAVLVAVGLILDSGRYPALMGLRGLYGQRNRSWLGGAALMSVAIVALTICYSFESEIRLGPNRAIEQMLPAEGDSPLWVFSAGTGHFMNTSTIDPVKAKQVSDLWSPTSEVVPFQMELTDVSSSESSQTSMVIRFPSEALEADGTLPSALSLPVCQEAQVCVPTGLDIVGDRGSPLEIGQVVSIGDEPGRFAGYTTGPVSLLNRLVFFGTIPSDAAGPVSGLLILPLAGSPSVGEVDGSLPSGLEVLSTDELLENNAGFWAGNGSTIMLVLMLVILVFATAAQFAYRRNELTMTRHSVATLRAVGTSHRQILYMYVVRSSITSLAAGAVAAVAAWTLVALSNAAVIGFSAELLVWMPLAATGVLLTADLAGSLILLHNERNTALAHQIRAK